VYEGKFAEVHLLKSALHSDSFIIYDNLFKFAEAHILKSTRHGDFFIGRIVGHVRLRKKVCQGERLSVVK